MEIISYIKGNYAQLHLDDDFHLFIDVKPEHITFYSQFFSASACKTLLKFSFKPFIQYRSPQAEEVLDLSLDSIKECKGISDLSQCLKSKTKPLLEAYFKKHQGISKTTSSNNEIWDIIEDYYKILEILPEATKFSSKIEIRLPYPKETISGAIKNALLIANDKNLIIALQISLYSLFLFNAEGQLLFYPKHVPTPTPAAPPAPHRIKVPPISKDHRVWQRLLNWAQRTPVINSYWVSVAEKIAHDLKVGKKMSDSRKADMKTCWKRAVNNGFAQ